MSRLDRFRRLTSEDKDRIRHEIIDNCDLMADCWIYKDANSSGYGVKYIQGRMQIVSRFMLAYSTRESLTIDADACHIMDCPYRACCNPAHLFWGTHSQNADEREDQERKSRESNLREQPHLYPQPMLGHETHEIHSQGCRRSVFSKFGSESRKWLTRKLLVFLTTYVGSEGGM